MSGELKWYEWHTVTERLQARLYALTKGRPYRLQLDTNFPTGYCDFIRKRVVVNPVAFDDVFAKEGLNGKKKDESNFLMARALTGHEALHCNYTGTDGVKAATKDPDVHNVWNILEDARIENIGSSESHVSQMLFKLLSATCMKMAPKFEDPSLSNPYTGVQLLLYWRFKYPVPKLDPDANKKWIRIRNLAEGALYAPTSLEVADIAKKIVDILGLKSENQKQNGLRDQLQQMLNKLMSQMEDSNNDRASKNPFDQPSPGGSSGSGGPSSQSKKNPEKSDNKDSGQTDKDESNSGQDDKDESDEEQDSEGSSEQDEGNPEQNPEDKDDENTSQGSGSPEDREDEDASSKNLSDLIDEIGDEIKDSLSSVKPSETKQQLRGAARSRYGEHQPDIIAQPYMEIYERALPIAQELERELKGPNPQASKGASPYPGRFSARHFIRDTSKPFVQQKYAGIKTPKMAISLVLDRSGSMNSMIEDLRVMATAVYLACEKLKIPLSIWVLEGQIHLKEFDEWGAHVMAKIAGITAQTNTTMLPTLNDATADLKKRPEDLKQIVLIHDGFPGDRPDVISWRKNLGHIGLYCMYIVNNYYSSAPPQRKSNAMDELVGPQNYIIAFVKEIAKFWCNFVRTRRNAN